ncbi:DUF1294 domain-containing protein [Pseudomonas gingeri]|uniref:DUF1294 domain-containing protein n=1 Tax=Pseudomonas TaxID=286 RepID=UPI0015A4C60F|nr:MULTISPECIES: DUF1294 domain-containing protein [Pseudomonas]NVZ62364.1 DUF1294 domain-containing protein [Pseudomonas gingeri]NVZ75281.1 DUF1294 domain-containing protein [Pseudomonas gingeri]BBP76860.1 hypothetical protein PHLH7_29640 [Pseudomonas sp. Ost2]
MKGPQTPERNRPASAGRLQHLRLKWAIWLVLCVLPGFGALKMWLSGGVSWPLWGYGVASLLAFFLYWSDKRKARNDTWRTPEKVLHGVELLGGWPGALIAQQAFRHKTRKLSFQLVFWAIVLLHQVFWIDQLFLGASLAHLSFL